MTVVLELFMLMPSTAAARSAHPITASESPPAGILAPGCTNLTGMWHGPHDPWVNITQHGSAVSTVAPWGSGSGSIAGYVVTMHDVNHNGAKGTHTIDVDASCSVWKDTASDTWTRCVTNPCEPFKPPPSPLPVPPRLPASIGPGPLLAARLSIGGSADVVGLTFETPANLTNYSPVVVFGTRSGNLTQLVRGTSSTPRNCMGAGSTQHWAHLPVRPGGVAYYYAFGDASLGMSVEYSFRSPAFPGGRVELAVVGDMGLWQAEATRSLLAKWALAGQVDAIIHNGDIGYADCQEGPVCGAAFPHGIKPVPGIPYLEWLQAFWTGVSTIATAVPYMQVAGNHEYAFDITVPNQTLAAPGCGLGYLEYETRADLMPWRESGSASPLYYSYSIGSVHVIALTGEPDTTEQVANPTWEPRYTNTSSPILRWLEQDLRAAAAARATGNISWIVIHIHYASQEYRGPTGYCTSTSCCNNVSEVCPQSEINQYVEDLMQQYRVDLYLTAHNHLYERTVPMYRYQGFGNGSKPFEPTISTGNLFVDPAHPIFVVNGAAGDVEVEGAWHPRPSWSVGPRLGSSTSDYGAVKITAHNSTTLQLEYIRSFDELKLDEMWIARTPPGCTNLTGMWHGPHDPWVNITQHGSAVSTVAPWGSGSGSIAGYVVTMHDVNHNGAKGTHTIDVDASCSVWKDTASDTWTRCVTNPCEPFKPPPRSVTVDFGACLRPAPTAQCSRARQVGSGILLSINETHPPEPVISPLLLRNHRGDFDNLEGDYGRLRAMDIDGSVQSVLMDLYFGRGMNPPPSDQAWPGDDGNWTHWTNFVTRTVMAAPDGLSLDIWNEPDGGTFWARSYQQYLELWAHGVRAARAVRPSATIVGPSIAHFSVEWMERFLNDCANLLVLPDVVSWHEWGDTGSEIPANVQATRSIVSRLGQHATGRCSKISINEMVPKRLNFNPGVHVSYFANLERAHVDSACHSCWPEPTTGEVCSANHFGPGVGDNCGQWGPQCKGGLTLDGLLTCDGNYQPRSVWWAYKAYGAVQGQLMTVHGDDRADGLAAVAPDGTATVAIGSLSSENTTLRLQLQNLPAELVGSARVVNLSIVSIDNTGVAVLAAPRVEHRQVSIVQSSGAVLLELPGSAAVFVAIGSFSAETVEKFVRTPQEWASKTDDDDRQDKEKKEKKDRDARPAITWVSNPVQDGELVMLQVVDHDNATMVLLTKLGGGAPLFKIQPTRIGHHSIFFLLPNAVHDDSGSLGKRYTVQLERGVDHTRSELVHINAPTVWWFQGDLGNRSSQGGWLRIFGTSLYLSQNIQDQTDWPLAHLCPVTHSDSSPAACLLLRADGINASSFHARFHVPESTPSGNYRLSISNAKTALPTAVSTYVYDQGQPFVNSSIVSIRPKPSIRTGAPAVCRFSVLDFGATGRSYNEASSAVRAAIAAAVLAANSTTRAEVYFPRGRYILDVEKSGLVVPSNVVLVGEARHLASIYFQEYNTTTAPTYYLRGDGGPWGLQSLTMYITGFFGSGSEAHGGVVSLAGTGAFLTDVRIHANSMAGLETVGTPNRGRVAYWGHFTLGILISLANARNFEVSDSYLYSEFQIFDTECARPGAAFGLIRRCKIWNGAEIYRWCQANQIIFEQNDCVSVTNNGGGGDIANYGEVPSSSHLYIADNSIHWTWGSDREVTTFDGGGSGYTGYHDAQSYMYGADRKPTIILSMPTLSSNANIYLGWAIFVLDGPGAGQYRRIVQAYSRTELVLDSLFVGVVAHVSLLQIVPMRGQVIMFRNRISDTGVLQFYGQAMESIVAQHTHERTDGFISIGTVEGTYSDFDRNCSTSSCQFGVNLQLQFLDNTVTESNHMWIWNQKESQGEGDWDWHHMYNDFSFVAVGRNVLSSQWDGPMSRNLVYRRNRVVGYGGFGFGDKTTDVILESCDVVNTTVGIHINESTTNVMTRNNTVNGAMKSDDITKPPLVHCREVVGLLLGGRRA